MIQIGSRYAIKDVTGTAMGFAKEKTIVVLWDGKKNHRLKLEGKIILLPDEKENVLNSMTCYNCNRDKPLEDFGKWKSGKYMKSCNDCLVIYKSFRKKKGGVADLETQTNQR